jgi:mono/diheme cytochrome c family protein
MKRLSFAALVGAIGAACVSVWASSYSATAQESEAALLAALIEEGDDIFHSIGCSGCHGDEGQGGAGPELAGNSALSSQSHVIGMIMDGNEVHGMPAWGDRLDDHEIAAVGTYIRNAWGNEFGIVHETAVGIRRPN